jgi:hypothetical protein
LWLYVITHFTSFISNLELTMNQRDDAMTKVASVARCLHAYYYQGSFDPSNIVVVGSYGKGTATRPPSDVDMLYLLPVSEYKRINQLIGNGQSQLLQEVKRTLSYTFPRTELSADGQVVKAPFNSFAIDVVPSFRCDDGIYITCHTPNGGSWRSSNPFAEYRTIAALDTIFENKATHLIKMLKVWKHNCKVPLKSIALEIVVCSFIRWWPHNTQSIYWYDWMVRDFFAYLWQYRNETVEISGIQERINLGDQWASRCESAYSRALKACEYEKQNFRKLAEDEWKKIFGDQFTRTN